MQRARTEVDIGKGAEASTEADTRPDVDTRTEPDVRTEPDTRRGLDTPTEPDTRTEPDTGLGLDARPDADVGGRSRRDLVRGLLLSAAALVIAPVAAVAWSRRRTAKYRAPAAPAAEAGFDETYRGRRIRGAATGGRGSGAAAGAGERWHVTVDGRPLHLMRRADGSYLSMVDHYWSYPTALAATRAAVDELGPGRLLSAPPAARRRKAGHEHNGGSRRGVHA